MLNSDLIPENRAGSNVSLRALTYSPNLGLTCSPNLGPCRMRGILVPCILRRRTESDEEKAFYAGADCVCTAAA